MHDFRKEIYLTFDLDWAREEVVDYTLDILETADVAATIFVTHGGAFLKRMRKNSRLELAVHPNFVPLEPVDYNVQDFMAWARKKIEGYKTLVPEANTIRSHGLTQNSRLLDLFKDMGYKRESNLLITLSSGLTLLPFYHWNGLMRVPYFWEDDIHCVEMLRGIYKDWRIEPFVYNNSIKIFNFHPIHIFLNSDSMDRYEKARPFFKNGDELYDFVDNECRGDRNFLMDVIEFGKAEGYVFKRLNQIEV